MAQGIARTPEEVEKLIFKELKPVMELGFSMTKACQAIGVPQATISDYLAKDDKQGGTLRLQMAAWRKQIDIQAVTNIQKSIKEGKVEDSKWWAERRIKDDFSTRTQVQLEDLTPEDEQEVKEHRDRAFGLLDEFIPDLTDDNTSA